MVGDYTVMYIFKIKKKNYDRLKHIAACIEDNIHSLLAEAAASDDNEPYIKQVIFQEEILEELMEILRDEI